MVKLFRRSWCRSRWRSSPNSWWRGWSRPGSRSSSRATGRTRRCRSRRRCHPRRRRWAGHRCRRCTSRDRRWCRCTGDWPWWWSRTPTNRPCWWWWSCWSCEAPGWCSRRLYSNRKNWNSYSFSWWVIFIFFLKYLLWFLFISHSFKIWQYLKWQSEIVWVESSCRLDNLFMMEMVIKQQLF